MIDRHLLGDIGLAILLALPTASLVRPEPAGHDEPTAQAPLPDKAVLADRTSVERRFSLLG